MIEQKGKGMDDDMNSDKKEIALINYMFYVWVTSGMFYRDFVSHVIDMLLTLETWTLRCEEHDDDSCEGLYVVPLESVIENIALPAPKIYQSCGRNLRFIPDIETNYIHSPQSVECETDMALITAYILHEQWLKQGNMSAAKWETIALAHSPLYYFDLSGLDIGGVLSNDQLLKKYYDDYCAMHKAVAQDSEKTGGSQNDQN